MCGLFASFSKQAIDVMSKVNSARGSHSFSTTNILKASDGFLQTYIDKQRGAFKISSAAEAGYKICHIQAPTTSAQSEANIHPAVISFPDFMLWHNGIIKDGDVKRLQKKHNSDEKWDTMLLLQEVIRGDTAANLSDIDGSFACFLKTPLGLYVFRNEISPLFYAENGDFSSVKMLGMQALPENTVFKLDLNFDTNTISLTKKAEFTTFANPYFFGE